MKRETYGDEATQVTVLDVCSEIIDGDTDVRRIQPSRSLESR